MPVLHSSFASRLSIHISTSYIAYLWQTWNSSNHLYEQVLKDLCYTSLFENVQCKSLGDFTQTSFASLHIIRPHILIDV